MKAIPAASLLGLGLIIGGLGIGCSAFEPERQETELASPPVQLEIEVIPQVVLVGQQAVLKMQQHTRCSEYLQWRVDGGRVFEKVGRMIYQAPIRPGLYTVTAAGRNRGRIVRAQQQIRVTSFQPGGEPRCGGLRCDRFVEFMQPEQAPPLHRPPRSSAPRASFLHPTSRVAGLRLHGEAVAYPLNLLAYHRVINDRVAGQGVSMAYSPLTESTWCRLSPEKMRHSGQIYENDDLLVDDNTHDLWSVLLGRSVAGRRVGQALTKGQGRALVREYQSTISESYDRTLGELKQYRGMTLTRFRTELSPAVMDQDIVFSSSSATNLIPDYYLYFNGKIEAGIPPLSVLGFLMLWAGHRRMQRRGRQK